MAFFLRRSSNLHRDSWNASSAVKQSLKAPGNGVGAQALEMPVKRSAEGGPCLGADAHVSFLPRACQRPCQSPVKRQSEDGKETEAKLYKVRVKRQISEHVACRGHRTRPVVERFAATDLSPTSATGWQLLATRPP